MIAPQCITLSNDCVDWSEQKDHIKFASWWTSWWAWVLTIICGLSNLKMFSHIMLTIWNILLVYCIHYIAERFIQEFEDNKGRLSETVNKKTCSDQKVNGQKNNNEWTPRSTGSELKITGRVSKSWYGVYTVVFYNNKPRKKRKKRKKTKTKNKKNKRRKKKTNKKKAKNWMDRSSTDVEIATVIWS